MPKYFVISTGSCPGTRRANRFPFFLTLNLICPRCLLSRGQTGACAPAALGDVVGPGPIAGANGAGGSEGDLLPLDVLPFSEALIAATLRSRDKTSVWRESHSLASLLGPLVCY